MNPFIVSLWTFWWIRAHYSQRIRDWFFARISYRSKVYRIQWIISKPFLTIPVYWFGRFSFHEYQIKLMMKVHRTYRASANGRQYIGWMELPILPYMIRKPNERDSGFNSTGYPVFKYRLFYNIAILTILYLKTNWRTNGNWIYKHRFLYQNTVVSQILICNQWMI